MLFTTDARHWSETVCKLFDGNGLRPLRFGAELLTAVIEGVEFLDGFPGDSAETGAGHGPAHRSDVRAIAADDVVLEGHPVVVGEAEQVLFFKRNAAIIDQMDEILRNMVANGAELMDAFLKEGCLPGEIPFADDGLEGNGCAHGQFVGGGADLHNGPDRFVEFSPAFGGGPGMREIATGESEQFESPPFFELELAAELRMKRLKEGELPIEMVRKPLHGREECSPAVREVDELIDEELRAALINGGVSAVELLVRGPAQFLERERRAFFEDIMRIAERIDRIAFVVFHGGH